jgi:hypothetical protein
MVEHPTTDEVLWTIMPNTESAQYGTRYLRPWKGKVRDVRNVVPSALFCSFDPETAVLDNDTNASVTLSFDNLYRTELEAWEAYNEILDKGMLELAQEKGTTARRIAELRREETER